PLNEFEIGSLVRNQRMADQTPPAVFRSGQCSVISGKTGKQLRERPRKMLNRSVAIGVQAEKLVWAAGLKIPHSSSQVQTCVVFVFVIQEVSFKSRICANDSPFRERLRRLNGSLRRKPASHIQQNSPWLEVRPLIQAQIGIDFLMPPRKREGWHDSSPGARQNARRNHCEEASHEG